MSQQRLAQIANAMAQRVGLQDNSEARPLLYTPEDRLVRIHIRVIDGDAWLTQKQLAELYKVGVPTISEHIANIYRQGMLSPTKTSRQLRVRQAEGRRSVSRDIVHYALPLVLEVGKRARSPRADHFRQWAAGLRLS